MKNSWKEYKERKEAQNFFRQNNDQFLSAQEWIKTILAGCVGAIAMGIVHGALTMKLNIDFSIIYIVIGIAVANILNSVSNVATKQIGIASVIITFFAFYISKLTIIVFTYSMLGISISSILPMLSIAFQSLLYGGILNMIFIVVGLFVAYQQGSINRFM